MAGAMETVTLPAALPWSLTVNAFSPDGKAMYVQKADGSSDGIIKVEFKPARQSVLRGTIGLRTIWHLTVAQPSGRIFVSGLNKNPQGGCGTFEIDPDAGTFRILRAGKYPDCGGGGGAISPDGKRLLSYEGEDSTVVELETGAVHVIRGIIRGIRGGPDQADVIWYRRATWSPDGRWISVTPVDKELVLIDATDTSRRRTLGSSGGAPVVWSPDSKYLLLSKSESQCAPYLYFESLEVIDVETGKRTVIKSSHCEVGPGWAGWIDLEAIR
jgi:DNA-binding beta-propeller fold protein YncE